MAKRKKLRKPQSKKIRRQKTIIVTKTKIRAEETLFPEKLKKANELLKELKLTGSW